MRKIQMSEVTWEVIATQDDCEVRGNALVSGDDAQDKEVEDEIINRLTDGDIWAWASVEVKGTWNGLSCSDYLGACSYDDEEGFCQPGGYYSDMQHEVLCGLQAMADKIVENLKETE